MFYAAFGLSIRSNRKIPGLVPKAPDAFTDTHISLGSFCWPSKAADEAGEVWYVSEEHDANAPALRVWRLREGAYFRLLYSDGTEFLVDRRGTNVWARWPDASTVEDTATYLLGPIIGFVLRLRGITCLHASAVAVGDHAIALLGPASAGKSTTAAGFSQMGLPILADDIVALSERCETVRAQPAYPQLRLWPDSVALLFGTADALPQLTPTWEKRGLNLTRRGYCFQEQSLPLAAVYLLAERSAQSEPQIEGIHGRERLLALLANTYVGYLLDARMRAQEFELLTRLISNVPVRRVVPSADPAHISRLCRRILSDCEALPCTVSPTTA